MLGFPAVVIAGLVIGRNRGAYRVQAEQAALLLAQREQLEAEQRRVDLLDERAHRQGDPRRAGALAGRAGHPDPGGSRGPDRSWRRGQGGRDPRHRAAEGGRRAGQPVSVRLDYDEAGVRLTIRNDLAPSPASDGLAEFSTVNGGYGLTGMRERLRLLTGSLQAGRRNNQWIVTAELPDSLTTPPPADQPRSPSESVSS